MALVQDSGTQFVARGLGGCRSREAASRIGANAPRRGINYERQRGQAGGNGYMSEPGIPLSATPKQHPYLGARWTRQGKGHPSLVLRCRLAQLTVKRRGPLRVVIRGSARAAGSGEPVGASTDRSDAARTPADVVGIALGYPPSCPRPGPGTPPSPQLMEKACH